MIASFQERLASKIENIRPVEHDQSDEEGDIVEISPENIDFDVFTCQENKRKLESQYLFRNCVDNLLNCLKFQQERKIRPVSATIDLTGSDSVSDSTSTTLKSVKAYRKRKIRARKSPVSSVRKLQANYFSLILLLHRGD